MPGAIGSRQYFKLQFILCILKSEFADLCTGSNFRKKLLVPGHFVAKHHVIVNMKDELKNMFLT